MGSFGFIRIGKARHIYPEALLRGTLKGYSVWMLRFKDIPEVLRLYEKNQKLQLGCIDGNKQYEHFWFKN